MNLAMVSCYYVKISFDRLTRVFRKNSVAMNHLALLIVYGWVSEMFLLINFQQNYLTKNFCQEWLG